MRVLVVGIGNTACDVSLSLRKHAATLYQSYRRGRILVSRYLDNGIPTDAELSWPTMRLKYFLDHHMPWLMTSVADRLLVNKMINDAARSEPVAPEVSRRERLNRAAHRVQEDWRLLPCSSMAHCGPTVQEHFIPALYEGNILPVHGFKEFAGGDRVLLDDGTVLEVDAVIFCTGYHLDISIMPEMEMDGAGGLPLKSAGSLSQEGRGDGEEILEEEEEEDRRYNQKPTIPRLYHMIFPPRWAASVAFLSWMTPLENVWNLCELASMAIAQIWAAETIRSKGEQMPRRDGYRPAALLPSLDEMNAQVDAYHVWWRGEWEKDQSIRSGYVQAYPFYRFLHDASGTGVYDNLDHIFSGRGWRLWWNDRELWTWLVHGPTNSYSWRIFETNPQGILGCGRKTWPGARKAVQRAVRLMIFDFQSTFFRGGFLRPYC